MSIKHVSAFQFPCSQESTPKDNSGQISTYGLGLGTSKRVLFRKLQVQQSAVVVYAGDAEAPLLVAHERDTEL